MAGAIKKIRAAVKRHYGEACKKLEQPALHFEVEHETFPLFFFSRGAIHLHLLWFNPLQRGGLPRAR